MKEVLFDNNLSIVFSAYKNCLPVLIYNNGPVLSDFNSLPDGLKCFIDNYSCAILFAIDSLATDSINHNWISLLNPTKSDKSVRTNQIYGPYLTTRWGQSSSNDYLDCSAYNYYVDLTSDSCNSCSTSSKCPTGCIATAMAQIMNYWKYPVYSPLLLEQFDWCNMPDALFKRINNNVNNNYEIERDAIAKLMAECGKAADMDYCCKNSLFLSERCASFTFPIDARNALVDTFFYHADADVKRRFFYTNKKWKQMLIDDIKNGRPVLYSGVSYENDEYKRGGHAFVCDGYDENTEKFHFNWGHLDDPAVDTWCTIDSIVEAGTYNWNHLERAVFNIYPDTFQDYCDFTLSLETHYNNYYTLLGNTTPPPYENVPKTMTHLISVPDNVQYPASWRTIPSGATSEYTAHKTVVLKDGFRAEAGSEFRAYINPCESCETSLRSSDESYEKPASKMRFAPIESQIEPHQLSKGISVYPNPNTGRFYIGLNDKQDSIKQITLYGILGNQIMTKKHLQSGDMDLSQFPPGVYVVKVLTNTGISYFEKVIKE